MAFNNVLVAGQQLALTTYPVFSTKKTVLSGSAGTYQLTAEMLRGGIIQVNDVDGSTNSHLTLPLGTDMTASYPKGGVYIGMSFMVYCCSNAGGASNTMYITANTGFNKVGSINTADDSGRVLLIRVVSIDNTTGIVTWEANLIS